MKYTYNVEVSRAAGHQKLIASTSDEGTLKSVLEGIMAEKAIGVIKCKELSDSNPDSTTCMMMVRSPNKRYISRFEIDSHDRPWDVPYRDELAEFMAVVMNGQ